MPVQNAVSVIARLIGQTPARPGCSSLVDDRPTRNNSVPQRERPADRPRKTHPTGPRFRAALEVVLMSKLSEPEILARLPMAKGWDRHGDMLVRTWQFHSFRRALEFVNQAGAIIE